MSHPPEYDASAPLRIVPVLYELFRPKSVLDIGCNTGLWLAAFAGCGVMDVCGVDIRCPSPLAFQKDRFVSHDLQLPLYLKRKFDLVLFLETAEHLEPYFARSIVASCCRHSLKVVFSAAHPGQGGHEHLNEQNREYWDELFGECGYLANGMGHILPDGSPAYLKTNMVYYHDSCGSLPAGWLTA